MFPGLHMDGVFLSTNASYLNMDLTGTALNHGKNLGENQRE